MVRNFENLVKVQEFTSSTWRLAIETVSSWKTKHSLFYLKTQFVPGSKHF